MPRSRPRLIRIAVLSILLTGGLAAAGDERVERLPEHHRKWLVEEVPYIISDVEREVFLGLQTEAEREAFIDAFWRKRDTNPSTPENEYKIEHYERLEYVNKFFGRDTFRKGWQTDRGKYYILLGPPRSRSNFSGKRGIYPAELWSYNNPELKKVGLPPFFFLLFFRRHGTGELELYSPVADGPQALLTRVNTKSMDFRNDVEAAYEELRFIDPELADASLSFRTDERDVAQFQAVPFGTLELIDDIVNAPFYGLDTSYAKRIDWERGMVESDYLFSYVPSRGQMNLIPGPADTFYLHWVVELDAQYVAFIKNEEENNYATVFIATVEIVPADDENTLAMDFRKESYVQLSESQVAAGALRRPFAYSGMTPLVPGKHRARVILRNRACPGRDNADCVKSYTLLESEVDVPAWQTERPTLGELVLAYGTERREGKPLYRPFRFGSVQLLPNPDGVFAIGDTLVVATEALNPPEKAKLVLEIRNPEAGDAPVLTKSVPARSGLNQEPLVEEFVLDGVAGGRYQLRAALVDASGDEISGRTVDFVVSPRSAIVRPSVRTRAPSVRPEVPGLVAMTLAEQYMNLGKDDRARPLLEEAVSANPKLGRARELLAKLAIDEGDAARVVELLEPVYREVPDRFEVLVLLGEAYFHERDYALAAELLEKAITLRRVEPRVLNVLAITQYQLGGRDRAKELIERSLELDPEQENAKAFLSRLEAEAKTPPR